MREKIGPEIGSEQPRESIRSQLESKVRFILNIMDKPGDIQVMPKNHKKNEFQKARVKLDKLHDEIKKDFGLPETGKSKNHKDTDKPEDENLKNQRESALEIENIVQKTVNLAEELINSFPTGAKLDDEYLENVATLAEDYYSRKNWHEQLDKYHIAEHQKRWRDVRDQKMTKICTSLIERSSN